MRSIELVGAASICIYTAFTKEDGTPRTPALFLPYTRGGHREGESRGGASGTQLALPDHGGSYNLRIRAPQSESNHRGIKRPIFYPSATSAASRSPRGISPRRPYGGRRFLPSVTPRPVGDRASPVCRLGESKPTTNFVQTGGRT